MKTTNRLSTPTAHLVSSTLFAGRSVALVILLVNLSSFAYAQRGPYDFSGKRPAEKMIEEGGDGGGNFGIGNAPVDPRSGKNTTAKGSNNPGNMLPPCTPQHQVNCNQAQKK